jgi:4-cresol dehydrogenase (hydroxylating)
MTQVVSDDVHILPDEALDAFRAALGEDAVFTEQADRDQYRDPYWYQEDRTYDSSAVLYPATTEQVQAVVRIANEHKVPLWPSSQGRNNGYGGPSPRVRGSVLVSLRRMNRVLEINHELAYAVVEPGVSWMDLHAALQEAGHEDLMVSVPDLGWGSVIGNTLDSGVTYLPLGMDFQAPTGMEVVLANGELMRTGMGALPDSKAWHVYKRGLGPVLDPLFVQSNYGIVTRAGIWLMRRPEAYAPCT